MPAVLLVLLPALLLGCGAKRQEETATPAGKATGEGTVVARIDDQVITAAQLQEQINKLPPFTRRRYEAAEQKKRFLENLVRFEVMAQEAKSRGYDRDPDVQRVLKQQMITEFLGKEVDAKLKAEDLSDVDVAAYYAAHKDEFVRPEAVRVSQILIKDKATAAKVAAEAKATARGTGARADEAFIALVRKHSQDEDSKGHGGDLTYFDRKTAPYPRPVVEASFALKDVGDVSDPIESDAGFHILKLKQRRPGFTRPLPEVQAEIRRLILQERRTKKIEELVAEMKQKVKVEIYEDELKKIPVQTSALVGASGTPKAPAEEHR